MLSILEWLCSQLMEAGQRCGTKEYQDYTGGEKVNVAVILNDITTENTEGTLLKLARSYDE